MVFCRFYCEPCKPQCFKVHHHCINQRLTASLRADNQRASCSYRCPGSAHGVRPAFSLLPFWPACSFLKAWIAAHMLYIYIHGAAAIRPAADEWWIRAVPGSYNRRGLLAVNAPTRSAQCTRAESQHTGLALALLASPLRTRARPANRTEASAPSEADRAVRTGPGRPNRTGACTADRGPPLRWSPSAS